MKNEEDKKQTNPNFLARANRCRVILVLETGYTRRDAGVVGQGKEEG